MAPSPDQQQWARYQSSVPQTQISDLGALLANAPSSGDQSPGGGGMGMGQPNPNQMAVNSGAAPPWPTNNAGVMPPPPVAPAPAAPITAPMSPAQGQLPNRAVQMPNRLPQRMPPPPVTPTTNTTTTPAGPTQARVNNPSPDRPPMGSTRLPTAPAPAPSPGIQGQQSPGRTQRPGQPPAPGAGQTFRQQNQQQFNRMNNVF